jgi:hypothetical protein
LRTIQAALFDRPVFCARDLRRQLTAIPAAAFAQSGEFEAFVFRLAAPESMAIDGAIHANFLALDRAVTICAIGSLSGTCACKHHQGAQQCG